MLGAPEGVVVLPLEDSAHRSHLVWAVRRDDDRPVVHDFVSDPAG